MKHTFIKLPTAKIEIDHIREMYDELHNNDFKYTKWFPRPALIEKTLKTSWLYTGQNFDPKLIELVQDGWTRDHCQICSATISEVDNEYSFSEAYFDNYDWVCKSCYELVLKSDNVEEFINKCEKIEKEY
ncbi:MAG TPA: hypothetical protein VLC98_03930 [Phnomibacter sp.]|nr:hypothetical protein [Phnomibacter sp.]